MRNGNGLVGVGIFAVLWTLLVFAINLALLAGAVWVVVWVLRSLGVIA